MQRSWEEMKVARAGSWGGDVLYDSEDFFGVVGSFCDSVSQVGALGV